MPREGWYVIKDRRHPGDACLVRGYHCPDMNGQFVFGFNISDGGGTIPLEDVPDDRLIARVELFQYDLQQMKEFKES